MGLGPLAYSAKGLDPWPCKAKGLGPCRNRATVGFPAGTGANRRRGGRGLRRCGSAPAVKAVVRPVSGLQNGRHHSRVLDPDRLSDQHPCMPIPRPPARIWATNPAPLPVGTARKPGGR